MIKGIAIGGGGVRGAFTAGKIVERDEDFEMAHGVSTGALIAPATLVKRWDILRRAYTTTTQSQITEKSAFKTNSMPRILFIIWRTIKSLLIKDVVTIGESMNLRSLIDFYYNDGFHRELGNSSKAAIVGAYSINYDEVFNANSTRMSWKRFKDFMHASANAGPVMSLVKLSREKYSEIEQFTDGGIKDNSNAEYLFMSGCEEVHLYLHVARARRKRKRDVKNVIHMLFRIILSFFRNVTTTDISLAIKSARAHRGKLVIHYLPESVANQNSFVFNPKKMKKDYDLGRSMAFNKSLIEVHDYSIRR